MQPEIQHFPWFDTVGKAEEPRETIWKYKRAIEGHKFILVGVILSAEVTGSGQMGHFQVYDGHTYSVWGSFPNIFDQATLGMHTLSVWQTSAYIDLHNWECKEITMSMRNRRTTDAFRFCAILFFYEVPMSKEDTLEYAVKQPRYKYRHGFATTLSRFED